MSKKEKKIKKATWLYLDQDAAEKFIKYNN